MRIIRGGSFVILNEYRTNEVNAAINKWIALGVVGETITMSLNLEVYATLSYPPRWTLDNEGYTNLVTPFFSNAGIPSSAYGGDSFSSWKKPAELDGCDDIFVQPHAELTYATHQNLIAWNRDAQGAIWASCHAVSILENVGINFLTTNGMITYTLHQGGTPPYTYSRPADPVMQFMGVQDDASNNGSEPIFLPQNGSSWNPGVVTYITQPGHPAIGPLSSTGPAAVVALGYGFDDPNRGLVMYQGGHSLNGDVNSGPPFGPQHIAAQRAFFNFSFLAVVDKQTRIVSSGPVITIIASPRMNAGTPYPVRFSVPASVDLSQYKIKWSVSSGQILPDATSREITYIPSADVRVKKVIITLSLTDNCNREFFGSLSVILKEVSVSKLVSSNGDGLGYDFLEIKNIEYYPDNEIDIYNRWGNVVYHAKGYDNNTVKFVGLNSKGKEVTDGVYYYALKIVDDLNPQTIQGYFILKR